MDNSPTNPASNRAEDSVSSVYYPGAATAATGDNLYPAGAPDPQTAPPVTESSGSPPPPRTTSSPGRPRLRWPFAVLLAIVLVTGLLKLYTDWEIARLEQQQQETQQELRQHTTIQNLIVGSLVTERLKAGNGEFDNLEVTGQTTLNELMAVIADIEELNVGRLNAGHTDVDHGDFNTLIVQGAWTIGNLRVDGNTTLADLLLDGQLRLTGNTEDMILLEPDGTGQSVFSVRSPEGHESVNLDASGNLQLDGRAEIGGTLTVDHEAAFLADVLIHGGLRVKESVQLEDSLSVAEATTLNDTLTVQGPTELQDSLTVQGPLQVDSEATFLADVTMEQNLSVQGQATTDDLVVIGTSDLQGAITNSTTSNQGRVYVDDDFEVTGTIYGTNMVLTGSVTQGDTTVNNLTVLGTADFLGAVTMSDTLNVGANTFYADPDTNRVGIGTTSPAQLLHVAGNALVDNDLTVSGSATITNNLSLGGNLSVSGNGFIDGPLTLGTQATTGDHAVRADRTLTMTGTTNQIDIAGGTQDLTGNRVWTFSLPQDIHTGATPTFTGLNLTGTSDSTLNLTGAGAGITFSSSAGDVNRIVTSTGSHLALMPAGNVGIGTTTPTELLHVAGNALIDNDLTVSGAASIASNLTAGGNLTVSGTGAFTGTVSGADASANDQFVTLGQLNDGSDPSTTAFVQGGNSFGSLATLGTTDNQDLRFITNNVERIRILASGEVGIGTDNPGAFRLNVQGGNVNIGSNLATGGTTRLDSSGNLLNIGNLTLSGAISGGTTYTGSGNITSTGGVLSIEGAGDNYLAGNLGLGTQTPSHKLHVVGDGLFTANLDVQGNTNLAGTLLVQDSATFSDTMTVSGMGTFSGGLTSSGATTVSGQLTVSGPSTFTNNVQITAPNTFLVGTSTFYVDPDTNRVGIGTINPTELLHVAGNALIDNDLTVSGSASIASNLTAGGNLTVSGTGSFTGTVSGADAAANDQFVTLGQLNDGSDPSTTVFVQGGNSFGSLATLGTTDNQDLRFIANNTEAMRVLADGNVGIGTDSPTEKLEVTDGGNTRLIVGTGVNVGDSTTGIDFKHRYTATGFPDGETLSYIRSIRSGVGGTGHLTFGTSSVTGEHAVERMRIINNGNVGIGTTAPAAKLHVNGEVRIGSNTAYEALRIRNAAAFGSYNGVFELHSNATPGSGTTAIATHFKSNVGSGTTRHDVLIDGNVGIGTTAPVNKLDVQGGIDATTLNTGQGDNELYAMNQNVRTTDSPTFGGLTLNGDASLGANHVTFDDGWVVGDGTLSNDFRITQSGTGGNEFQIFGDGADYTNVYAKIGNATQINSNGISYLNGGNVGVGTNAPANLLHVSGGTGIVARFSGRVIGGDAVNADEFITLGQLNDGSDPSTTVFVQGGNSFGTLATLGTTDNQDLRLITNNAEAMRVLANGNVGIGTDSPSELLVVGEDIGNITGNNAIVLGAAGTSNAQFFIGNDLDNFGNLFWDGSNDDLHIRTASAGMLNASQLVLDSSGNVGIGTATPTELLHVAGNALVDNDLTVSGSAIIANNLTAGGNLSVSGTGFIDGPLTLGTQATTGDHAVRADRNLTMTGTTNQIDIAGGTQDLTGNRVWTFSLPQDIHTGATPTFTGLNLTGTSDSTLNLTGTGAGITFSSSAGDVNRIVTSTGSHLALMPAGNVGIGTATPTELLQVAGNALVDNDLTVSGAASIASNLSVGGNLTVSGTGSFTGTVSGADATANNQFVTLGQLNDGSDPSTTVFVQGGNSFGSLATLGTTDNQDLRFITNNSEAMRVLANGNVGIGTTSPSYTLDVSNAAGTAAARFNSDTSSIASLGSSLVLKRTTSGDMVDGFGLGTAYFIQDSAGVDNVIGQTGFRRDGADNSGRFIVRTYNAGTPNDAFTVLANGNVGIGTATPSRLLEVVGGTAGTETILGQLRSSFTDTNTATTLRFGNSTGDNVPQGSAEITALRTNTGTSGATDLIFRTSVGASMTEKLRIQADGNVGIGTATPGAKLDVAGDAEINGTISGVDELILSDTTDQTNYITGPLNRSLVVRSGNINGTDDHLGFEVDTDTSGGTSYSRVMTLNHSGNVGIGTTAPDYKLHVSGGTGIVAQFSGRVIGGDAVNNDEFVTLGQLEGGGTDAFLQNGNSFGALATLGTTDANDLRFMTNSTEAMRVLANGNVGIGTTSFVANAPSPTVALNSNGLITGGAASTNLSAVQFTAQAGTDAGYGAWLMSNAYWDGSSWRQPRGALRSTMFTANYHKGFSWNYAAGNGTNDAIITPAQIANLSTTGTLNLTGQLQVEGTGNSYVMGNVGIGTTNPKQKLHVAGDYYGRGHMYLYALEGDGSSGTAYLQARDDSGTSSIDLRLRTQNAGSFVDAVTIKNTGNVGIGTLSPAELLHVSKDQDAATQIRVNNQDTGASSYAGLQLNGQGNNLFVRNWGDGTANANITEFLSTAGGSAFVFSPANSEALRITSANNVGIGTTTPNSLLDVNGQVRVRGANKLVFTNVNTTAYLQAPTTNITRLGNDETTGRLEFFANGAERVRIDSSGNVGIGTTAPSSRLQIGDTAANSANMLLFGKTVTTANAHLPRIHHASVLGANDLAIGSSASSGGILFYTGNITDQGSLLGTNANTAKMAIDTDGNVGIGTTSPTAALHIQRTGEGAGKVQLRLGTSGTTYWDLGRDQTSGHFAILDQAGNNRLHINSTDGNVGIGTASPQTSLEVGANTAAAEVITVRSQGFSGLDLIGDSANGSGEPGGAYVRLSQDGNLVQGILGMVNTAGEDGSGSTYTGTLGNSMLLGTKAGNSPLHLGASSAVQLTVAGDGNVGIGTSSPSDKLTVNNGSLAVHSTGTQLKVHDTSATDPNDFFTAAYNNNQLLWRYRDDSAGTWTDILNMESNGNVGIGTTTPGAKLHVQGTSDQVQTIVRGNGTQTADLFQVQNSGSTVLASINASGNFLYTSGTADTNTAVCRNAAGQLAACTSLSSTKADVQDLNLGMDEIRQLRAVGFTLKATGEADYGFIAEEVAAINPLLGQYDRETGKLNGVKYTQMTALLTRGVQQLDQRVSHLEKLAGTSSEGSYLQNGDDASFASLNVSGATTLNTLTVNGAATFKGKVAVEELDVKTTLTIGGRIISQGDQPEIAAGEALALDMSEYENLPEEDRPRPAEFIIDGTDTAGTITVNTNDVYDKGEIAEVIFSEVFGRDKPRVLLTPGNSAANSSGTYVDFASLSNKSFFLHSDEPFEKDTMYIFNYFVIESGGE